MKKHWMVKAVLLGALVMLGVSAIFMLLWNWLVPTLFRGPLISWWQALGLLTIAKLLLGGWKHWGSSRYVGRHTWKKKFEDKWNNMTPEEQERFKRSFTNQCHRWRWSEPEPESEKKDAESGRIKVG